MRDDIGEKPPVPPRYKLYRYNSEKQHMELAVMDGVATVNINAGDWLYFVESNKAKDMQGGQV